MKQRILLIVTTILSIGILAGCQKTDLVGDISKSSFKEVLNVSSEQTTKDEMNGGWSLSAPDNSARFIWSEDYSKSPIHDVMIEFDAKPFIDAGLDVTKLPEGVAYEDKIMLGTKLGDDKPAYTGESTPENTFNQIVNLYRKTIGYHHALDHYGVDLSGGNMFEWAKDMKTNDKDIVFVVNPEQFIEAGVDPENVEGWIYASVEMMDKTGKKFEEMKLLKPFDLTN